MAVVAWWWGKGGGVKHGKMLFKIIDSISVSFLSPLINVTLSIFCTFFTMSLFFDFKVPIYPSNDHAT